MKAMAKTEIRFLKHSSTKKLPSNFPKAEETIPKIFKITTDLELVLGSSV